MLLFYCCWSFFSFIFFQSPFLWDIPLVSAGRRLIKNCNMFNILILSEIVFTLVVAFEFKVSSLIVEFLCVLHYPKLDYKKLHNNIAIKDPNLAQHTICTFTSLKWSTWYMQRTHPCYMRCSIYGVQFYT
jgi:hypothetical protein